MKVLISAYACEPGKGSEPEVGWQWITYLSNHCDVVVLTRSNNKNHIEAHLSADQSSKIRFEYLDLSFFSKWLKKRLKPDFLSVSWYYGIWQKRARKKIAAMCQHESFDLIHHITIASFRLPFAVTGHGIPSIVGPVGGCEDFPEQLFSERGYKIQMKERLRNWMTKLHVDKGWGMDRFHRADQVVASTREMGKAFGHWGIDSVVIPQIGMPLREEPFIESARRTGGELKLLFVGGILCWKGIELAIQALVHLPDQVSLSIVGSGPDTHFLMQEVQRLGLTERVKFLGRVARNDVLKLYQEFDVFLYPSLHDSGAFTVLEAMDQGLPVICLDRGGPALSVNQSCGRVVKVGSRAETIRGLSQAIDMYLQSPEMLTEHGRAARKRVMEKYEWGKKSLEMMELYRSVTSREKEKNEGGSRL